MPQDFKFKYGLSELPRTTASLVIVWKVVTMIRATLHALLSRDFESLQEVKSLPSPLGILAGLPLALTNILQSNTV